jgi:transposase
MRAAHLLRKGLSEAEVARQVGVHRQSVNRWQRQLQTEGRLGLKRAGRAGRKPQLTPVELRRLGRLLKQGPEAFGFMTNLWTLPRVAQVIAQEWGIHYHPGHVWRVLRQIGWSCQRPTGRALERDEKAIRRWKRQRWPELKKKPARGAKRSSSSTKAG